MANAAPRPCPRPGCGRLVKFGEACPVHPVKDNSFADRRRGSRQSRGYDAEWERARQVAIERDRGLCQPCLKENTPPRVTRYHAVDHVVSKAQAQRLGWTREQMDDPGNLQCICRPCHTAKTQREAQAGRAGGGGVGMFGRLVAGPTG